ncbi:MAG: hypothetical protein IPP11_09215 [Chitinophagaceae bacterium]|nr:hypothetical protein [Chitinophagaceae bacterium]
MSLPLNGRIAIIDNELDQALPLMKVFAKNHLPYVFYKGDDIAFLPDENSRFNDIRLLFLDINLLNSKTASNKEVKASLYSVIRRVISENNFPYSLIYWSRQENEYGQIVEELFDNELKDRRPINLIPFVKSDFFPNFSDVEVDNDIDLIAEIEKVINSQHAYSYLLEWENMTHTAADKTLQDVFSSYYQFKDWTNNANYILEKLGNAYLGKHYNDNPPEDKIKASFIAFNSVFKDTLEHNVYNTKLSNPHNLVYNSEKVESKVHSINEKLNISKDVKNVSESGNIIVFEEADDVFGKLVNKLISIFQLKNYLRFKNKEIEEVELKKLTAKEHKNIKEEIKKAWVKLAIVVTPVCDYVQKDNKIYDRIVKGLLIPSEYRDFIDDKSEAVYVLPISINYSAKQYILILDFRYFSTTDLSVDKATPIFRLRQELLAEIQSKLARHINRQGILFLDERE